jgi:hypothetical protein
VLGVGTWMSSWTASSKAISMVYTRAVRTLCPCANADPKQYMVFSRYATAASSRPRSTWQPLLSNGQIICSELRQTCSRSGKASSKLGQAALQQTPGCNSPSDWIWATSEALLC